MTESTWEERVAQAKQRRASELPAKWLISATQLPQPLTEGTVIDFPRASGLLTAEELEITDLALSELIESIKCRRYAAEIVCLAYCHRAAIAHQLTNCLSVMIFDKALERARELDKHLEDTGDTVGPLHGVPVSLKDTFYLKGTPAGIGIAKWAAEESDINSANVDVLTDLGAVLYCKTASAMGMLSMADTESNVQGLTTNPLNRALSAGGSSGGESALIALGGSIVGLGTDIGGSLRVPVVNCGIVGFKPTANRFSSYGERTVLDAQLNVKSSTGPIARDLESLDLFTKIIWGYGSQRYDSGVLPLPYREISVRDKLKFGIVRSDGFVKPIKGVQRAMDLVKKSLEQQGHQVVEYEPPKMGELWLEHVTFFTADGGRALQNALDDEPLLPQFKNISDGLGKELSTAAVWEAQRRIAAADRLLFEDWKAKGLDGVICAMNPLAGSQHRPFIYNNYTLYWNYVDYPAVALPVTRLVDGDGTTTEINSSENIIEQLVYSGWDLELAKGAVVGVQVVAPRFQDENALKYAKILSQALEELNLK